MIEVSRYGMCSPHSQCKVLQNWHEPVSVLIFRGDRLELFSNFKHVGDPITPSGGVNKDVSSGTARDRTTFATCNTYGALSPTMTSNFASREERIMSQLILFCPVLKLLAHWR